MIVIIIVVVVVVVVIGALWPGSDSWQVLFLASAHMSSVVSYAGDGNRVISVDLSTGYTRSSDSPDAHRTLNAGRLDC